QQFYKDLFGWDFQDMEGPTEYHMTRISDSSGAAVFPGDPDAIRVYFDVDDINAGVSKLRQPRGEADDPQPVPTMAWLATGKETDGTQIGPGQTARSATGRG